MYLFSFILQRSSLVSLTIEELLHYGLSCWQGCTNHRYRSIPSPATEWYLQWTLNYRYSSTILVVITRTCNALHWHGSLTGKRKESWQRSIQSRLLIITDYNWLSVTSCTIETIQKFLDYFEHIPWCSLVLVCTVTSHVDRVYDCITDLYIIHVIGRSMRLFHCHWIGIMRWLNLIEDCVSTTCA